jgi:hypothetical protein
MRVIVYEQLGQMLLKPLRYYSDYHVESPG